MGVILKKIFKSILSAIAPDSCLICGRNMEMHDTPICPYCLAQLPRTGLHLQLNSDFVQRFCTAGVMVSNATALFHYEPHSPIADCIHHFKYNNRSRLAYKFGRLMALEMAGTGLLEDVDCIVPVPIHPLRRMQRGYNQSELIAEGMREVIGKPVATWLKASRPHRSQTEFNPEQRAVNASANRFNVSGSPSLGGKHILIVDDVCTTGATIKSCIASITAYEPHCRFTIFTLAVAR